MLITSIDLEHHKIIKVYADKFVILQINNTEQM